MNKENTIVLEGIDGFGKTTTSENKGKLFVLEGTDGSGKTTMANNLTKRLKDKGLPFVNYSFPTNKVKLYQDNDSVYKYSPYHAYKEIRSLLQEGNNIPTDLVQFLIIENGRFFFNGVVKENLDNGINVIVDRWYASNIVYSTANNGAILYSAYKFLRDDDIFNKRKKIIENIPDYTRTVDLFRYVTKFCMVDPEVYPEKVFFLDPGKDILEQNSLERTDSKEPNDKIDKVMYTKSLFYNFYKSLVENWNFISFGGNHYGDNYIRYKIYDGRSNVVAAYEDLLDIYRYITPEKENMTKEEVFNEMEETILNEIVDKIKRRV